MFFFIGICSNNYFYIDFNSKCYGATLKNPIKYPVNVQMYY